ncbi:MAG TPA: FtsQ-type POTRA domain-containing protein [Candidatus Desulfaltia sp.]|nr:FtsQ-type POTRA domain-containing protein [Candidatus Desulfaltia sp.]
MAILNASLKHRALAAYGEPLEFKRSRAKAPVKKVQRKLTVRSRHIVLFFVVLAGFFFGLTKGYLYLVSCDDFAVKKIEVVCRRDFVGRDIRALLDSSKFGNLLLLDIRALQDRLESHRWVKEARLRKVFPSSLKVELTEREPVALLKIGGSFLMIDEEGVGLESLAAREDVNLPLLLDRSFFQNRYREKIALAWRCLSALTPEQRPELEALDLSENHCVSAFLRGLTTRFILGDERFSERLSFIRSYLEEMEGQNGPLEYVDLRFDDRIIFKPLPALELAAIPNTQEEVN